MVICGKSFFYFSFLLLLRTLLLHMYIFAHLRLQSFVTWIYNDFCFLNQATLYLNFLPIFLVREIQVSFTANVPKLLLNEKHNNHIYVYVTIYDIYLKTVCIMLFSTVLESNWVSLFGKSGSLSIVSHHLYLNRGRRTSVKQCI